MAPVQENEAPRSRKDPKVRARRRAMLDDPHIRNLAQFVADLRSQCRFEVPDFDPADGGVGASLLLLFEKPGPMASGRGVGEKKGSGFVSRDNDDITSEFTLQFLRAAKIPRKETIIWNAIPRWNGTRNIVAGEFAEGMEDFNKLVNFLPNLKGIILVGRKTLRAKSKIRHDNIHLFHSYHPSLLVKNSHPKDWLSIPGAWSAAARKIGVI